VTRRRRLLLGTAAGGLIAAVPAAAAQSSGKVLRLGWLRGPVRLGDGAVRQAASGARILFAGSFNAATFGVFTIASAPPRPESAPGVCRQDLACRIAF
jgi:hypothetical protein